MEVDGVFAGHHLAHRAGLLSAGHLSETYFSAIVRQCVIIIGDRLKKLKQFYFITKIVSSSSTKVKPKYKIIIA